MEELIKEITHLKEQLLLQQEQLFLKEEQLLRKNELILLLQRQLYGRRSEKRLPDYSNAGPTLFDCSTGDDTLEQEKAITQTIIEEISVKAQKRREKSKKNSHRVLGRYKLPNDLEWVTDTIEPDELDLLTMIKIGEDVVDKFLHHLPKYRQSLRFKSMGVEIPTSSINRWVHRLADKLYLLYKLQVNNVLSSDYIQVDETTIPIAHRKDKTRKGYLWVA